MTLPSANVTIDAEAGPLAGGTGYVVVFACVERNADLTPRVFASARSLLAQHGYSPGVAYVAKHIQGTRKPVILVGLPTATDGAIAREDASGVNGSSVISIAAGANGYLEEVDASIEVENGGTVGTDQITFFLSLDGGRTRKRIRLGTATSYTIPYVGIVVSFGAGDLDAGDTYTFTTTAPMWDGDGIAAARVALAAQQKLSRSWMPIGDCATDTVAGYVETAVNAYETENERFTYARVQVRDRLPLAEMSRVTVRMTGTPTITFAEVGGTGDTITRSAGSFIADGFVAGMVVTVSGAVAGTGHNNITGKITNVAASVLTLDTADLDAEGPISGVTIVGSYGLVFTTTTATRSGGSWLAEGFRVGDSVTFDGTASNDITVTITVLTATVMTFAAGGSAETIGTRSVTCTKGETMAAWVSSMDAEFAPIDASPRMDIGIGRLRTLCPITGWEFRRPVQWAASIREYQHDVHIPCWRKSDESLDGWSMEDDENNIVEFDERTDGGALAARFTCARTWANGPEGPFIAESLTRATEGSTLGFTHNMAVANIACTVTHKATEDAIGSSLELDDDGHATAAALSSIASKVNDDLEIALLSEKVIGEGKRASKAVWTPSTDDDLRGTDATLTGVTELHLNGTIVHVDTVVRVS